MRVYYFSRQEPSPPSNHSVQSKSSLTRFDVIILIKTARMAIEHTGLFEFALLEPLRNIRLDFQNPFKTRK